MALVSMAFAWFMTLFSIGNSMVAQHNATQMQKQQMAQQQALMQQQARQEAEREASILHCPNGLSGVVIEHKDGTYEAVCP
jgi:hypothetical protein